VFAVDTDSASLEQARRLGAGTDVPARVDVVIDTVGNERTPAMGVEMLRTGGRLVLIGYTGLAAQVDVARIVTGEIIVRGSVGATLGDAREAVRLLAAGQLRAVISRRLPLAETNQALSLLEGGGVVGRIVLEP
jgi:D-arabinose 1-dehydrogenase-like Zn-dependent alcohol dehydrogenase